MVATRSSTLVTTSTTATTTTAIKPLLLSDFHNLAILYLITSWLFIYSLYCNTTLNTYITYVLTLLLTDNDNKKSELVNISNGCIFISIIIPAKNEDAVIARTIESFSNVNYPSNSYELIIVDDHSDDKTNDFIKSKLNSYKWLKLVNRVEIGGGKAGAMNSGFNHIDKKSQVIGYIDADTTIHIDLLQDINIFFQKPTLYALQVARMTRPTQCFGLLEKFQYFEVWMDFHYQQTRQATNGCVEFRGNGEFLRLSLLNEMGGSNAWNEDSLTDDLDMSVKIHLAGYNITLYSGKCVLDDPVHTWIELWKQRQRWLRGGYQRFVDYCYQIVFNSYSIQKKMNFLHTFLIYIADLFFSILFSKSPALQFCYNALVLNLVGTMIIAWNIALKNAQWNSRSKFDYWISRLIFLITPLYLVNLFVAAIDSCYRTAFSPRRLHYIKAVHEVQTENLNSYKINFGKLSSIFAISFPIMILVVFLQITLSPIFSKV